VVCFCNVRVSVLMRHDLLAIRGAKFHHPRYISSINRNNRDATYSSIDKTFRLRPRQFQKKALAVAYSYYCGGYRFASSYEISSSPILTSFASEVVTRYLNLCHICNQKRRWYHHPRFPGLQFQKDRKMRLAKPVSPFPTR